MEKIISNFWLPFLMSGTSTFSLLKLSTIKTTTYYLIIISINCYFYVDELFFNLTITKLTYFNKFVIYYIDPFQCI